MAAIGPMAPQPSLALAIAFIFIMAPVLRPASIHEAKPYALELREKLSGPINRQDIQLYLRSKGLQASEMTRRRLCSMDAMQGSAPCTLREAIITELTEYEPELRAIIASEGFIDRIISSHARVAGIG